MKKYIVAAGRSVMTPNGTHLLPDTEIIDAHGISKQALEDHLKNGFVYSPGSDAVVPSTPVVPLPNTSAGKWDMNPAQLQGKTIEQLNLLVLERDSTQKPFETAEEAIAHLSQDFKA